MQEKLEKSTENLQSKISYLKRDLSFLEDAGKIRKKHRKSLEQNFISEKGFKFSSRKKVNKWNYAFMSYKQDI